MLLAISFAVLLVWVFHYFIFILFVFGLLAKDGATLISIKRRVGFFNISFHFFCKIYLV